MSLDTKSLIEFIDTEFRRRFRSVIDQITLPIPRRVDQYTCWPGLKVLNTSFESGRLELAFKRNPSKIRVGEYVYVNPMGVAPKDVISGPEGVVEAIDEHAGIMTIRPGYQQKSRFGGRYAIGDMLVLDQTLPAARMSREMPTLALRYMAGDMGTSAQIEKIQGFLSGKIKAQPTGAPAPNLKADAALAKLTQMQGLALTQAITQDLTLIQGPPGTGKTHVLGLIIRELVKSGLKVAVCAFTHQAINNVLLECLQYEDIPAVTKIGNLQSWREEKGQPRLRLIASPGTFFRTKKTPSVTGLTQYAAFQPIAKHLERATADGIEARFDVMVFDEASQLTLPSAMMAMAQCDRFIFAGDHKQLPPVVSSMKAGRGVATSIFQHLVEEAQQDAVMLDESFRLNEGLVNFPSKEFYDGILKSAPSARNRQLEFTAPCRYPELLEQGPPCQLVLVKHAGRGQESPEEAALVADLVNDAIDSGVAPEEIAVIAPHRRQNVRIREFLAKTGLDDKNILIDTVERIQGQERDLVILSMTLSDPDILNAEIDFLYLPNRFNVATTRARRKLLVIASPCFFRALPRPESFDCLGQDPLPEINVLKRWYFEHRETAIDATEAAFRMLQTLNQ